MSGLAGRPSKSSKQDGQVSITLPLLSLVLGWVVRLVIVGHENDVAGVGCEKAVTGDL